MRINNVNLEFAFLPFETQKPYVIVCYAITSKRNTRQIKEIINIFDILKNS